jgi:Tfp pilus assembly protein PilP
MMREGFFIGVAFFLLVLFTSAIRSYGQEEQGEASILKESAMADISNLPRFKYNALGRRDPFLSFVKPADEVSKGLPPLQQVMLSSLKLIGVAWSGSGYSAMIQAPDGKSYPVKKGTKMGTNQGRIKDIDAKEIIVEEPYLNIFGRSDLKQTVIKLYTKKEGIE